MIEWLALAWETFLAYSLLGYTGFLVGGFARWFVRGIPKETNTSWRPFVDMAFMIFVLSAILTWADFSHLATSYMRLWTTFSTGLGGS